MRHGGATCLGRLCFQQKQFALDGFITCRRSNQIVPQNVPLHLVRPFNAAPLARRPKEEVGVGLAGRPPLNKSLRDSPSWSPKPLTLSGHNTDGSIVEVHVTSYHDFLAQSDLLDPESKSSTRLVNDPRFKQNPELWSSLLAFRLNRFGVRGAEEIWNGLVERQVDIPTRGEHADYIWSTLIAVGLENAGQDFDLVKSVFDYSKKIFKTSGQRFEPMYEQVLGFCFQNQANQVLVWHRRLQDIDLPSPGSLNRLIPYIVKNKALLKPFKAVYQDSRNQGIYDTLIPALCERRWFSEAIEWHEFLMGVEDLPLDIRSSEVLRQHLLQIKSDKVHVISKPIKDGSVFLQNSKPNIVPPAPNFKINRGFMNEVLGDVHGITSKTASDHFCARVMATKAFSIDTIVTAFGIFGIDAVGPLALRELAIRAETPEGLIARLTQLRDAKITIGNTTYSRLILQAALKNNSELLASVLSSDAHPEVFEDEKLQASLLHQYLATRDWHQAWRTLSVLTLSSDGYQKVRAWNIALCAVIEQQNWDMITRFVNEMLEQGIQIQSGTIKKSFFKLIPPQSRPGRTPPPTAGVDGLLFTTNLWLTMVRGGIDIPAESWNRLHTYYGMLGRLEELETLSIWLAFHYSRQRSGQETRHLRIQRGPNPPELLKPSSAYRKTSLEELFNATRLRSIIEWGFLSLGRDMPKSRGSLSDDRATVVGSMKCEPWARGIALLRQLQDYGLRVSTSLIKSACKHRLRILFLPPRTAGRQEPAKRLGRSAKRNNRQSLEYMAQHINEVWGKKVFDAPDSLMDQLTAPGMCSTTKPANKVSSPDEARSDVQQQARGLKVRHVPMP